MKKLIAVVLILCLLIPAAVAEAPDVKSLSDDDVKALYKDVKAELMERKLWDESVLPAGVYVAGMGLPEGTYECTATSSGQVVIYPDYKTFAENGYMIDWMRIEPGEKFTLSLYGEVCYLIKFNSIVRPFVGLDW